MYVPTKYAFAPDKYTELNYMFEANINSKTCMPRVFETGIHTHTAHCGNAEEILKFGHLGVVRRMCANSKGRCAFARTSNAMRNWPTWNVARSSVCGARVVCTARLTFRTRQASAWCRRSGACPTIAAVVAAQMGTCERGALMVCVVICCAPPNTTFPSTFRIEVIYK